MQLVSQAQANPKPFMGRHLRYESARAHRSLWISYKTPVQFMPCTSQDGTLNAYMRLLSHLFVCPYDFVLFYPEEGNDIVVDENGTKGRWIESDLPDALRIWKPRDARYASVKCTSLGDHKLFTV